MKRRKCLAFVLSIGLSILCLAGCAGGAAHPDYAPCVEDDEQVSLYNYGESLTDLKSGCNPAKHQQFYLWGKKQSDVEYIPYLTQVEEKDRESPSVTTYLVNSNAPTGLVIVIPGGGYIMRSSVEGKSVAEYINQNMHMSVLLLSYRCTPYNYRAILSDELRAIRFARYFANDLNIDPSQVAVMGFSAGGHLALMAGEHFDYGKSGGDAIDAMSSRPDAAILAYPVVSMSGECTHEASRDNFLRGEDTQEKRLDFSGELGVREDTPPVFLIHCKDDDTVPIENSYQLADALAAKGVPCETHWYDAGGHGFGFNSDNENTDTWKVELARWLITDQGFRAAD